ncbi:Crp/Fnr family transcriptional regulator [Croceibacterium aestuarii]|uniref:Crp/Fnr family transcriptional regulator n=1 Tax=Croceibacterium aestuarii TaxID=3064139 RepID=UPI00272DDA3B|nr:Crp/Fnr family transcriptional regulator [Croceibacterium sp. D39]
MARKFARRGLLDASDHKALLALPFHSRIAEPGRYLVREGDSLVESSLLISGLAFRHKLTADGDRQIVSIHVPGDFVDLEGSLLKTADHSVQTLTRAKVATISQDAIVALIDGHPRIARALWVDTLIDASIYREWVMNVGRRPARQRIAHLLCEFARRLELAEMGDTEGYEFPMTQEQLADATGLTVVHVNRTLKALEDDRLIVREKRFLAIPDWGRLRDMSGFNELYLHLDQVQ